MDDPRLRSRTRPFVWMLGFALVMLGAIAVYWLVTLRTELVAERTRDLQQQLGDLVSVWEDGFIEELEGWIDEAATEPADAAAYQHQLRKRERWFDSVFLWMPPPAVPLRGRPKIVRGTLLFPSYPATEDTRRLRLHPCLRDARAVAVADQADPLGMARRYIAGCAQADLDVRLVAATEAATLYERVGQLEDAIRALDSVPLVDSLALSEGVAQGIDPFRLVTRRIQRASLLLRTGHDSEGLDLYYETGAQIALLDAPSADGLLEQIHWPIVHELQHHGRDDQADRLLTLHGRADRRLRAWREIEQRILPQTAKGLSSEPRLVYDQYEETPFLLYYALVRDGRLGVAFVLDQPKIMDDLLGDLHRFRDEVVIIDSSGNRIAGQRGTGTIALTVPFNRTLTHLRVGLRRGAIDAEVARYSGQWVLPAIVVLASVLVGLVGLVSTIRATERQLELLRRQRDFTTRVTHELKTPLAGIRVMAENIESGAYAGEAKLRQAAVRIRDETDRLTSRVEEILAIGGARSAGTMSVFDPEEPLIEAVVQWEPRLTEAGITFHADMEPTDSIHGDVIALRDAVSCLLDNALKYHDDRKPDPQVWLTLRQEGTQVVIEVKDNGIGVPPNQRKQIFERFVRVEGPNRGKAGGHGLGLAQVAEMAAQHHGTVRCLDGVDGGVTFSLTLPAVS